MRETYRVRFNHEPCCDRCNDTIHTHFDCPACDTDYAGTSNYSAMSSGESFTCESCDARFKITGKVPFTMPGGYKTEIVKL